MSRFTVPFALLALLGLLLPTTAAAQTTSRVAGPSAPTLMGKLELSLADAVRMAIENNLDVELLRFDPLLAREDVSIAWGAYDPEAFGEGGYAIDETPNANTLVPTAQIRTQNTDGLVGLRGLLPVIGGDYQLTYSGNEELTNSAVQLLSPEFRSQFLLRARVPLLRGLVWNEPWVQVRISKIGAQRSIDAFRQGLMDIVAGTEQKYWELVAAQEQTRVAEKSLETARALLEQSQAQYEVGVVSRVDVVESEAGVADREFNLIRDRATEKNIQDELIDLVLGPFLAAKTVLQVIPTERPDVLPVSGVDVEAATEKAFKNRPELAVAREDVQGRKVQAQFRRNQRLPQFDIEGSWGYNGLSGRTNDDCRVFGTGADGMSCRDLPVENQFGVVRRLFGSFPPGVKPGFWDANDRFFLRRAPRFE